MDIVASAPTEDVLYCMYLANGNKNTDATLLLGSTFLFARCYPLA